MSPKQGDAAHESRALYKCQSQESTCHISPRVLFFPPQSLPRTISIPSHPSLSLRRLSKKTRRAERETEAGGGDSQLLTAQPRWSHSLPLGEQPRDCAKLLIFQGPWRQQKEPLLLPLPIPSWVQPSGGFGGAEEGTAGSWRDGEESTGCVGTACQRPGYWGQHRVTGHRRHLATAGTGTGSTGRARHSKRQQLPRFNSLLHQYAALFPYRRGSAEQILRAPACLGQAQLSLTKCRGARM